MPESENMTFKHLWSPLEKSVIQELIDLKPAPDDKRSIETRLMFDLLSFFGKVRNRNEKCFQLWRFLKDDPRLPQSLGDSCIRHWDGYYNHWWITAFAQGAAVVLAGADPLESENISKFDAMYDFFFSPEHDRAFSVKLPRLPERIKDKNFLEAISKGDTARIMVLYDLILNPGEKLKNIFNILLNKREYTMLMQLQERYGLLDSYDEEVLFSHFISHSADPGKKEFDQWFSKRGFRFSLEQWQKYCVNNPLSAPLVIALQMEVSTDWPLIENGDFSVPLSRGLAFIDEFVPLLDSWEIETDEEQQTVFDRQILRLQLCGIAAKVFFAAEKESRDI